TETGLPLSVLKIRGEHQAGIFELGMNRRGEIAELASVLCPQYAVITNIGAAHIGKLGSVQTIAEEKKQIFSRFTSSCVGFIPENDPFADFLAQGVPGKIIRYGDPAKAGVTGIMPQGIDGTRFDYEGKSVLFPLSGKYNLQNALAVIALARECGLSAGEIRAGLESVKAIFGRSQIFRGNLTIIQDCYNANPGSMGAAMEFFNGLETGGRKIFVLGDMLELGGASASAHRDMVSEAVKAAGVSAARGGAYLALMGPEMAAAFASQADAVPAGVTVGVFPSAADADMERAAEKIQRFAQKGDMVLLKGSRGMALERLTPLIGGGNNGV
ncbi:MAG: hypothetical protein LBS97_07510, partial [Treponema sp.]|nr:hypothetical protein [Treponema sp.]